MKDETVGNFQLVERLGAGGMGEVWVARQKQVGTDHAIKLLLPHVSEDADLIERFFNEARAVNRIDHAGIVKISDAGFTASGRAYLVMELLRGETLASRIKKGRLSLAEVGELGAQIASVLRATHEQNITHRDLKPDNIFLVADAERASGVRVKILDFGIAKLSSTVAASLGTQGSMGTPPYMAPEQWANAGEVDRRADLYSFGCVLFEMAAGRPPFTGVSMADFCFKHTQSPPPKLGEIAPTMPDALGTLVGRLLAKAPEDRPASLREVERELTALAREKEKEKPKPTPDAPAAPRSKLPFVLAGAVAIAAGGIGIYMATRSAPTGAPEGTCTHAAAHIGTFALGTPGVRAKMEAAMRRIIETRCAEDRWSASVIECLDKATGGREILPCVALGGAGARDRLDAEFDRQMALASADWVTDGDTALSLIDPIVFDAQDGVDEEAKPLASALARYLVAHPATRIELGVYADTPAASERRATALRTFLVERHVKPAQLEPKGYGVGAPRVVLQILAATDTPELPPLLTILSTTDLDFDRNAVQITNAAVLQPATDALRDPAARVEVYAHAQANELAGLAKLRGDAVADFLVQRGIGRDRIAIEPSIADDRRVTISVVK